MKKLGLVLCLSSSVFLAQAAHAQWQGNFLLGANAGWAWHNGNDDALNVTITHTAGVAPTVASFARDDGSDSRFFGGFLAGYQAKCNGWLLGGEVSVDWINRHHDNDLGTVAISTPHDGVITFTGFDDHNNDAVVGLTARLGYEVSPYFMPYVRLGAEYSDRNDFGYTASAPTGAPAPFSAVANNDNNNHHWGFVGGLGAEVPVPVFSGISFRGEWNYHSRHHGDDNHTVVASDGLHTFTTNGDGHRHANTLKFSLVWNIPA